jgi:dTDP-4-amino-4,6-dideoxygalactose transaminase
MSSAVGPFRIPFNRPPSFEGVGREVARAIAGGHTAGGGPFSKSCEEILGRLLGVPVLLTTSCTHALEAAALLLGTGPDDEVAVPSFTFVSTANAFVLSGARIRFIDCDADGNISIEHLETVLTPRTRVVVPVHYAGNSCDMDRLLAVCARAGAAVVEDAAQTIGATFRGRPLGALGDLGCLSFHETKNLSAGEGGALVLGKESLRTRADHVRDKGTNRRAFSLGMAEKYSWVDVGSSWAPSDLNAAYLAAQLDRMEEIQRRRAELWKRYDAALRPVVASAGGRTLSTPTHNDPNHHLFGIVWSDRPTRDRFIQHTASRGILTPFHYVPLHTSPFGVRYATGERLPGTESLGNGLVRLPLFYNLSDAEQNEVIETVREFCRMG